jgi:hypothetical protein
MWHKDMNFKAIAVHPHKTCTCDKYACPLHVTVEYVETFELYMLFPL